MFRMIKMPKIYIDARDPSRSISANQARTITRKLVSGLHAAGLKRGDCVCLHSFNDIYYPMLFLGIIAAGGIFTGTNPSYTSHELTHHIKTSRAKFLITEPEIFTNILIAAEECATIPDGSRSFKDLMSHGEKDWVRFNDEKTCRETTAARLFSSGTTGLPKAAALSHYNFIAQHVLVYEQNPRPYTIRRILSLPMFHAACAPVAHTSALKGGQVSVIMRRFELGPFLSHVKAYKINELALVPPIVIAIIMSDLTEDKLNAVKHVEIGASPLGKASQNKLKRLCAPGATVDQVWGMTETSCICSRSYYGEDDTTGSVGRMLPNIDAKIIDEEGNDITAYDVSGELCVRGPTVISGYLDRKKELIKVRGFQVAPSEIESVLLSHPLIVDAAVIGVRSSAGDGEMPRAYVVKRLVEESMNLTEEDVKEWCGKRLANYKKLTGGVGFVKAIPKNASGRF
ncbi:hypothetical protein DID88_004325 [Monilinia fructigena]|uniref:AMP-dependent synthetase/ligase domain-containing protein n=1 Tax=Monilinia fructigena TaxID=38457 RepID=A0A395ISF6_9HELO|nr:hypothetical protein DID88_004325 [Monilinia fructigena]